MIRRPVSIGALLLSAALLGACAGYEERPDPFAELVLELEPPTSPHDLPPWPSWEPRDGGAWFSVGAMRELSIARAAAEANHAIALEHAQQIEALQEALRELALAGQAEHAIAELRGHQLAEERWARLWSPWLWIGLGLLGVGVSN